MRPKSALPDPKDMKLGPRPRLGESRLAHRIFALCELAGVRNYPDSREPSFRHLDFGEREPDETYSVHPNGTVIVHRQDYSGHNGDAYNCRQERLDGEKSLKCMEALCSNLESRALAVEERRLAEAETHRRQAAAKKNLDARLRAKGIA